MRLNGRATKQVIRQKIIHFKNAVSRNFELRAQARFLLHE